MTDDLEPISPEADAAAVAAVVEGHDQPPEPPLTVAAIAGVRSVTIATCVAFACFSAAVLIVVVALVSVIRNQSDTIGSERAGRTQAEARVASLQSQVSDQNNQALCRAQIANDYESAAVDHGHDTDARLGFFFEALSAVAAQDPGAFADALGKANTAETAAAKSSAALDAAAEARQESVATCQKASRPGG